jgi:hypothetical protein
LHYNKQSLAFFINKKQKIMKKTTLQPGDTLGGVLIIPKNVFVEIKDPGNRNEEMQIASFIQILTDEDKKPHIMCGCENQEFRWLLERHKRGEVINKEKSFAFKVQVTCTRCKRPLSLDIGPSNECYEILRKSITGKKKWSEEITKTFNDHFHKKH